MIDKRTFDFPTIFRDLTTASLGGKAIVSGGSHPLVRTSPGCVPHDTLSSPSETIGSASSADKKSATTQYGRAPDRGLARDRLFARLAAIGDLEHTS